MNIGMTKDGTPLLVVLVSNEDGVIYPVALDDDTTRLVYNFLLNLMGGKIKVFDSVDSVSLVKTKEHPNESA